MEQVLLVVQVVIAIGLIGMVLIQRSDSDGFGLSGGSGNNLMSGRSAANTLTRITAILATLFIVNSLALGVIAARGHAPSIAETIEEQQSGEGAVPTVPLAGAEKETPAKKVSDAPEVPVDGEKKKTKKSDADVEDSNE